MLSESTLELLSYYCSEPAKVEWIMLDEFNKAPMEECHRLMEQYKLVILPEDTNKYFLIEKE